MRRNSNVDFVDIDYALRAVSNAKLKAYRNGYADGWADAMKEIRKKALELAPGPRIKITASEIVEDRDAAGVSVNSSN